MTSGEFDLSVGSVFGFAPVVMWTFFNAGVMPLPAAFLVAMLIAAGIGLFSGLFVTRLKIPSFLVTLGMLLVVRGTALFITDGFPQRTWNSQGHWLAEILVGDFMVGPFRIYVSLFWFIAAALILGWVLNRSKFGNWIQASGGNPAAARARGVPVERGEGHGSSCSARAWRPSPASSPRSAPRRPTRTAAPATSSRSSPWW